MQTLELETMRCELDGPLARLRFNRPEALNAANWTWVHNLITAMNHLAQSSETHVLIISGEGRAFCSGLDTKELAQGHLTLEWFETWERGIIALTNLNVISIAAIHGYCLGGDQFGHERFWVLVKGGINLVLGVQEGGKWDGQQFLG